MQIIPGKERTDKEAISIMNYENEQCYVFLNTRTGVMVICEGDNPEYFIEKYSYYRLMGKYPQEISREERERYNCSVGMWHGKSCECGFHPKSKREKQKEKKMENQKIEYIQKTLECIQAGTDGTIQNRYEDGEWGNCPEKYADYYSCMLFRNGKHIPLPMLINAFRKKSVPWKKLNTQEKLIRVHINSFEKELIKKIVKLEQCMFC